MQKNILSKTIIIAILLIIGISLILIADLLKTQRENLDYLTIQLQQNETGSINLSDTFDEFISEKNEKDFQQDITHKHYNQRTNILYGMVNENSNNIISIRSELDSLKTEVKELRKLVSQLKKIRTVREVLSDSVTTGVTSVKRRYTRIVRLTAYCASCNGTKTFSKRTASGEEPKAYKTCAANFVPLGTYIEVEGYGILKVIDRCGSRSLVDIYVGDYHKCRCSVIGVHGHAQVWWSE